MSVVIPDATADYTLQGRMSYTPSPALTITLQPSYTANYREDRSGGGNTPTLRRRQLSMTV